MSAGAPKAPRAFHVLIEPYPEAYIRSHVRRLEALRRAGQVERVHVEHWTIPKDLPERGLTYDRSLAREGPNFRRAWWHRSTRSPQPLQRREVERVVADLAKSTGLTYRLSARGEYVGTVSLQLQLVSGRFAMLEDGLGFQLVPCSPSSTSRSAVTFPESGAATAGSNGRLAGRGGWGCEGPSHSVTLHGHLRDMASQT